MRGARAANPYEYGAIVLYILLACVPHAFAERTPDGAGRPALLLIERNILMILLRY